MTNCLLSWFFLEEFTSRVFVVKTLNRSMFSSSSSHSASQPGFSWKNLHRERRPPVTLTIHRINLAHEFFSSSSYSLGMRPSHLSHYLQIVLLLYFLFCLPKSHVRPCYFPKNEKFFLWAGLRNPGDCLNLWGAQIPILRFLPHLILSRNLSIPKTTCQPPTPKRSPDSLGHDIQNIKLTLQALKFKSIENQILSPVRSPQQQFSSLLPCKGKMLKS